MTGPTPARHAHTADQDGSVSTVLVRAVRVPRALTDPDAEDFLALARVLNDALEHDIGYDHLRWVAGEMLPEWQDQSDRIVRGFLAVDGTRTIGALLVDLSADATAVELEFELGVLPDARHRGVEDVLFDTLVQTARAFGRSRLQNYSVHRADAPGARLESPTGFGALPQDHATAFLRAHGFALQQVERNSAFVLPGDRARLHRMRDAAARAAGPEYRTVLWTAPTPPEYQSAFAALLARMSTDVPTGGLTVTEEQWDAERVRRRDARHLAGGLTHGVAAVEHVPTGDLVAYNELMIGTDGSRPTHQWGTLVVREHRGHRLGTLVKCANLLRWPEIAPASPFVSTFNAEENRPMLDVNEALGFTPLTVAGAWQLVLDDGDAAGAEEAAVSDDAGTAGRSDSTGS